VRIKSVECQRSAAGFYTFRGRLGVEVEVGFALIGAVRSPVFQEIVQADVVKNPFRRDELPWPPWLRL
jgi:hypothetical protein